MLEPGTAATYQLHVSLIGVSPMIWRRLLVSGDSTLADLHYILQIAMGWSDDHLNRFTIHGKDYGVYHPGGICFSDDPSQVRLADFQLREREKFFYEYNFNARWRHQIRVEAVAHSEHPLPTPVCLAGKRAVPPEDCGGPDAFLAKRQHYSVGYGLEIVEDIRYNGPEVVGDHLEEICLLVRWLSLEKFARKAVNCRLRQYATGDRDWLFVEEIENADPSSAYFGQW
jgi:Plasmid pRiA4b ORF-3-like protein.